MAKYIQIPPIDSNGCDSVGRNSDGNPCKTVIGTQNTVNSSATPSTVQISAGVPNTYPQDIVVGGAVAVGITYLLWAWTHNVVVTVIGGALLLALLIKWLSKKPKPKPPCNCPTPVDPACVDKCLGG